MFNEQYYDDYSVTGCTGLKTEFMNELIEVCDTEWMEIGHDPISKERNEKKFHQLISLITETYYKCKDIITSPLGRHFAVIDFHEKLQWEHSNGNECKHWKWFLELMKREFV